MSPEILLGNEFDLPTDIFSMGIIFCEMASRKLADDDHFKRTGPKFGLDMEEVRKSVNPGCPPAFLALCLDCIAEDPAARPTTRTILDRLREIEAEVLARPETEDHHLGSVRFMSGGKRRGGAPRIPSFGMGIGKDIGRKPPTLAEDMMAALSSGEDSTSDEEAVASIQNAPISDSDNSVQPLLNTSSSLHYSTSVIRGPSPTAPDTELPPLSSILTIKPVLDPNNSPDPIPGAALQEDSFTDAGSDSILSIQTNFSYRTAPSFTPSTAAATRGHSSFQGIHMLHRFTLIGPGAKRSPMTPLGRHIDGGWNPLELFFPNGLFGQKCDICFKRLGWKPILECDDCGLRRVPDYDIRSVGITQWSNRAHVKCGEVAPRDCGMRILSAAAQSQCAPPAGPPLLKARQNNVKRLPLSPVAR
ncbi:hypothetical protein ID866_9137 [Astraeus odoratus]|nr:hypothetical protein ID866_9137 [Astraeus odoratus]